MPELPDPELPDRLRLADLLIEGGLAAYITKHRAAGRSWEWIARELYLETGRQIAVSAVRVQSWAAILDIPDKPTTDEAAV